MDGSPVQGQADRGTGGWRAFAYDEGRDKLFRDGEELTPVVLADLRLFIARTLPASRVPGLRSVKDAARALGRQRPSPLVSSPTF